jgi:ATP-binding protein involved in chromosome partitioning
MIDPRISVIDKRLKNVKRIIAVSGGKGGIGKSVVSSLLALCLAKNGKKVGLLDLDLSSPTTHVILGINKVCPTEDKGLIPPVIFNNISFMSVIYFSGNNPSPLRGNDVSNAIIELLAITIWNDLDFLIIDMPPGISDTSLDVIRLIKRMEYLIVTIPSRVALEVTKKEVKVLKELGIRIAGVLENMRRDEKAFVEEEINNLNISILGSIDFEDTFENAIGNAKKLLHTNFATKLDKIVRDKIN